MIRILHLETSTKACSVALSFDGEPVAVREELTEEFTHSENLAVFVQSVLDQAKTVGDVVKSVGLENGGMVKKKYYQA